jgi:hypothetical protein
LRDTSGFQTTGNRNTGRLDIQIGSRRLPSIERAEAGVTIAASILPFGDEKQNQAFEPGRFTQY